MGDEILMDAIKHVKTSTAAEAAQPSGDAVGLAAPAKPAAPAAAPGTPTAAPAPSAAPAPAPEKPALPKSVAEAWALIEERHAGVEHRERELKAREKDIEDRIAKLQSNNLQAQQHDFLSEVRKDPLKVLADAGVSWQALAERVMAGAPVPDPKKPEEPKQGGLTKEEVAEIVANAIRERDQQYAAQQGDLYYQQQIELALKHDEYKLLAAFPDAKKMIWDEAVRLAHEQKKVLPAEKVASIVQEMQREKLKTILGADVVAQALGLTVSKPEPASETLSSAAGKPAASVPQTLNAGAGQPTTRPNQVEGPKSEHEILLEALKHVRREQ